jgi:hypothetical protein
MSTSGVSLGDGNRGQSKWTDDGAPFAWWLLIADGRVLVPLELGDLPDRNQSMAESLDWRLVV